MFRVFLCLTLFVFACLCLTSASYAAAPACDHGQCTAQASAGEAHCGLFGRCHADGRLRRLGRWAAAPIAWLRDREPLRSGLRAFRARGGLLRGGCRCH